MGEVAPIIVGNVRLGAGLRLHGGDAPAAVGDVEGEILGLRFEDENVDLALMPTVGGTFGPQHSIFTGLDLALALPRAPRFAPTTRIGVGVRVDDRSFHPRLSLGLDVPLWAPTPHTGFSAAATYSYDGAHVISLGLRANMDLTDQYR